MLQETALQGVAGCVWPRNSSTRNPLSLAPVQTFKLTTNNCWPDKKKQKKHMLDNFFNLQ